MLNLTILTFLFAAVLSEVDIEQFYGKWLPAITYPDTVMIPFCHWYDISRKNTTEQCQCGEFKDVPIVQLTMATDEDIAFPVIVVNSAEKVASTLQLECECDEKRKEHLVFRKISENYFVEYEHQTSTTYTEQEPNTANLMLKKIPKLSELEAVSKSGDLSNRKGGYMCPLSTFLNDTP